jgi:hypothetical protein
MLHGRFCQIFRFGFFPGGQSELPTHMGTCSSKEKFKIFLPHSSFKALKWFTLAVLEILKNFLVWYTPGNPSPHHFDLNFGD